MTKQSDKLRAQAAGVMRAASNSMEKLHAEAERLDAIYVPEPVYADGTSVIMFSRTRPGDRAHIYAAVRDPLRGAWAAVSPVNASSAFRTNDWDELLQQIQGGPDTKWTIWHGELEELAASPELAGPASEPGEAPTCEHGHARYSESLSSQTSGLGGALKSCGRTEG